MNSAVKRVEEITKRIKMNMFGTQFQIIVDLDKKYTYYDFSHVDTDWDVTTFLEKRNAYDANDNVQYQGWAKPGTAAAAAGWHIVKHTWGAGAVSGFNLERTQQADDEIIFDKIWNDMATYF